MFFGKVAYSQEISIEDLKVGVVPAEVIIKRVTREGVRSFEKVEQTRANEEAKDALYGIRAWGLTEEDVEELKALREEGVFEGFGNRLLIQQTIPFAPAVLFGVMLTLIFRGSFVLPLIGWLRRVF